MTRVFVGIGSNLGDSAGIVRDAFERLRSLGSHYLNSDLYVTQPWGKTDQPDFINAVAAFETTTAAKVLLAQLRRIEAEFGRQRDEPWGPRTLDLDLLLYGDAVVNDRDLTIPHAQLRERAFVLEPLAEIAPEARIPPEGRTAAELRDALPQEERSGARRLVGTAALTRPPRVDYDAPAGAGSEYDNLRPFSTFDRAVLQAVLEATAPLDGRRVLDVGCGTGRFTEKLAEAGGRVLGLDPSETMLAAARARASDGAIEYVRGDANESLPAGPFDAVTAFYCVQYLDVDALARRARAALREGGSIAIASFPHRHFTQIEFARYFPSLPAIDMARFPSTPAIRRALEAAHFSGIETRDIPVTIEDDPSALIARVERKYLSSFFLLPAAEFREGIEAMRRDWQGQSIVRRTALGVVVSGANKR